MTRLTSGESIDRCRAWLGTKGIELSRHTISRHRHHAPITAITLIEQTSRLLKKYRVRPPRRPRQSPEVDLAHRRAYKQRMGESPEWRAGQAERVRRHYWRTREARLAYRRDYRKRRPEIVRAQARRHRVRKRSNGVEPYRDLDIFERDGWVCGICHKRVNRLRAYPDPLSPSIDHILPVSDGGPDTPVNVRLAHLVCNTARGNRGDVQLRLIA